MSFLHKPQSHFDDLLPVHDHDQLLCLLDDIFILEQLICELMKRLG